MLLQATANACRRVGRPNINKQTNVIAASYQRFCSYLWAKRQVKGGSEANPSRGDGEWLRAWENEDRDTAEQNGRFARPDSCEQLNKGSQHPSL
jgi:hypothetical protein